MLIQKIVKLRVSIVLSIVALLGFSLLVFSSPALADPPGGGKGSPAPTTCPAGTSGTYPNCQPIAQPSQLQKSVQNTKIVQDIQTIVNFLSAGVAIFVTGSIIYAGIRYATAGSQPNTVVEARNRIIDSVIALLAFLLIFAFIQWLIPGGVFG